MARTAPKPRRQQRLATKQLDETLAAYKPMLLGHTPKGGWIKAIRAALGMSAAQYAKRLGVTRARVYQLESEEVAGSLTLDTLSRAANALNCRLVYSFVPETSLEQIIEDQARTKVLTRMKKIDATMGLEAQRIKASGMETQIDELTRELVLLRPRDLWD
jgi:predicted DNA-binding mobile mystery protein A